MLRAERDLNITRWLRVNHVVGISKLSKRLGVSENTVRRDLHRLEKIGILRHIYGGAVLNEDSQGRDDLEWRKREGKFAEEKERIGRAGAEMVKEGEAIILDAGTTTMQIVRFLNNKSDLTVVTNAVNIAMELSDKKEITTVLTGGIFRKISLSLVSSLAEGFLDTGIHVDKVFLSAGGVNLENGVTNSNSIEVPIKRAMIRASKEVILVVTHDKIGKSSFTQIVPIKKLDKIITDKSASQEQVELIRKGEIEVILV